MLSPEEARQLFVRRHARQHRRWLVEETAATASAPAAWPMELPVGRPNEQAFIDDPAGVRRWVAAWEAVQDGWPAGVRVDWVERNWPRLGRQRLPQRIVLDDAAAVAAVVGEGPRWARACERATGLVAAWPQLAGRPVLGRLYDALADYAPADHERLAGLLRWVRAHPASGLYLRQLPVPGLDTKWIGGRAAVVTELLRALRDGGAPSGSDGDGSSHDSSDSTGAGSGSGSGSGGGGGGGGNASDGEGGDSIGIGTGSTGNGTGTSNRSADDLHALLGLKRAPARLRVRLLGADLRAAAGGLGDIEAPVAELARLPFAPRAVLIVENLETGLALPAWPGVAAVMGLGAAVRLVGGVGWIVQAPRCVYWGDVDSHGFEILNRARSVLPQVESVLMDVDTLLAHRELCVAEPVQAAVAGLPWLTAAEREVFDGLRSNRWGAALRLEQERIAWPLALRELQARIGGAVRLPDDAGGSPVRG